MSNENKKKELSKKYFKGKFPSSDEAMAKIMPTDFHIHKVSGTIHIRRLIGAIIRFPKSLHSEADDWIMIANTILYSIYGEEYLDIDMSTKLNLVKQCSARVMIETSLMVIPVTAVTEFMNYYEIQELEKQKNINNAL